MAVFPLLQVHSLPFRNEYIDSSHRRLVDQLEGSSSPYFILNPLAIAGEVVAERSQPGRYVVGIEVSHHVHVECCPRLAESGAGQRASKEITHTYLFESFCIQLQRARPGPGRSLEPGLRLGSEGHEREFTP